MSLATKTAITKDHPNHYCFEMITTHPPKEKNGIKYCPACFTCMTNLGRVSIAEKVSST